MNILEKLAKTRKEFNESITPEQKEAFDELEELNYEYQYPNLYSHQDWEKLHFLFDDVEISLMENFIELIKKGLWSIDGYDEMEVRYFRAIKNWYDNKINFKEFLEIRGSEKEYIEILRGEYICFLRNKFGDNTK